ncbi:MAG: N-acetylneuraminate synthase [Clostridia bacterium]|nr:N-acetylneuraminate synthase [Clostridia bacterium]
MSILVIAEAGVNHNGSFDMACQLVDAACEIGADVIKFQTFIPENLVTNTAPMADYQKKRVTDASSQLEMLKRIALSFDDFRRLSDYCQKKGIQFLSTPFDLESIDFLHEIGMTCWKLPSGEITNYPYLRKVAEYGGKMILSTGMCTLQDVEDAVRVFRDNGVDDLTLLHCTTEYPAKPESVNLRAMETLRQHFNCPVGYSDHTKGITASIAAAAMGATIIEKHFTLDRNLPGPDHKASLEVSQFSDMIRRIRKVEKMLGSGVKEPAPDEYGNRRVARKSIIAARPICAGEQFTEENLTTKRPGTGITPMRWTEIIGRTASRNYGKDEQIDASEL